MLENINYALFALINATPSSSWWAIEVATFIAKDLIIIVPLLVVALWLWGPNQRQLVFKVMLALALSLSISWVIGHLFPHDRPFVDGVGYNFLHHAADDSFPSDHGTVIFTFALAFLFWHRVWSGALLLVIASAIAWSRVYLGVHWPLDMLGGLLAGMCGCLGAQLLWQSGGHGLYQRLQRLYRLCFSLPIRKGWVRG
ncbi:MULTISPECIES: undecaprenyl-diphosphate phosphatase [Klebsiella]|jgi:undecaprenyl-diphosphatase|uniref:undecaprenyl-diphosphate phosphatase n=2 Tax=Klebsiella aerogenes TaxID=548 RepID=A0AAW9LN75_KLEAE|nr:undecaprenyl-diphosphate phosphatase [Klebsiella aerogenes]MCL6717466.1 undecaprenyl-diphosphate phosphatase [Klebsiella sp. T2.Ur]AEG97872.1 undecaprenyl pyrophosphate phosphatase [Klebsiella aerogenes KCTC 2190]EIV2479856.1 undecaprenyl-diphosphate phosphatase [Klebsiella aerogenes]EIV3800829.1 undecaprenyl-diphosphate phosphatase [Klebsiella aerogenes]EIV5804329.1 undecaprenyl-diphosphate phosphatase [Klebsiella aerogenes]